MDSNYLGELFVAGTGSTSMTRGQHMSSSFVSNSSRPLSGACCALFRALSRSVEKFGAWRSTCLPSFVQLQQSKFTSYYCRFDTRFVHGFILFLLHYLFEISVAGSTAMILGQELSSFIANALRPSSGACVALFKVILNLVSRIYYLLRHLAHGVLYVSCNCSNEQSNHFVHN